MLQEDTCVCDHLAGYVNVNGECIKQTTTTPPDPCEKCKSKLNTKCRILNDGSARCPCKLGYKNYGNGCVLKTTTPPPPTTTTPPPTTPKLTTTTENPCAKCD